MERCADDWRGATPSLLKTWAQVIPLVESADGALIVAGGGMRGGGTPSYASIRTG